MYKSMTSYIEERSIEGINKEEICLTFQVWQDNRVFCFLDLEDYRDICYWYETVVLSDEDILKNKGKTSNIEPKDLVDYIIDNMTEENILNLEWLSENIVSHIGLSFTRNYVNPFEQAVNIVDKSIFR